MLIALVDSYRNAGNSCCVIHNLLLTQAAVDIFVHSLNSSCHTDVDSEPSIVVSAVVLISYIIMSTCYCCSVYIIAAGIFSILQCAKNVYMIHFVAKGPDARL